ncbi:hypothetical protein LCGC14_0284780 [marine sediment metagenome]|uniref:CN hydrolase domain-containing protein n=1 Tax=marine sediment metagenome TaxID=412755 RepID=A0A0F9TZV6_9ZZZZ|nr:apolipoprotein N-acyltransferase [Phycisphaerae bacterium]HDZ45011.1 apolipoprotein N-acyltransferase [Phycisphaerae bacterium]
MQRPTHKSGSPKAGKTRSPKAAAPPRPRGGAAEWLGRWWAVVGLCLLTVVLLTFSFAPWNGWPLGYLALVPWMLALAFGRRGRLTLWTAAAAGLVFWAANLYWLTWITPVGYAAGSMYLSLFWLAAAVMLRAALRRRWPMWLTLPVVWVALEYVRTHGVGFPWHFLAHSQYARTTLIQIADLTGQYGLSFLLAMINGVIVDAALAALRRGDGPRWWARRRVIVGAAVAVTALGGVIGYGAWRLGQKTQTLGPVIGIVQEAVPTTLYRRGEGPQKTLRRYTAASEAFIGQQCDLVIWPETVLPAGMNSEVRSIRTSRAPIGPLRGLARVLLGDKVDDPRVTDRAVRDFVWRYIDDLNKWGIEVGLLSTGLRCPILAGGSALRPAAEQDGSWIVSNGALLFDRSPMPKVVYAKVHPVPFSEYVPFRTSWPWLHRKLRGFVPPSMAQLVPGERIRRFALSSDKQTWTLASPICYEGTFARICRRMVMDRGRKVAHLLVNISNDGWFVQPGGGETNGLSTEHAQHLVAYCFRAVENRVPIVRAVNTGISASVDSNGRIIAVLAGRRGLGVGSPAQAGQLLLTSAEAKGDEGGAIRAPQVLVDSRVSVYSLAGDVFAWLVSAAAVIMLGWILCRKKKAGA